jgi:hypothetical protein
VLKENISTFSGRCPRTVRRYKGRITEGAVTVARKRRRNATSVQFTMNRKSIYLRPLILLHRQEDITATTRTPNPYQ